VKNMRSIIAFMAIIIMLLTGCDIGLQNGIGATELGWNGEFDSVRIEPNVFASLEKMYNETYDGYTIVRGFGLDYHTYASMEKLKEEITAISEDPQTHAQYFLLKDETVIDTCKEKDGQFIDNRYPYGRYFGEDLTCIYKYSDILVNNKIDIEKVKGVLYSNTLTMDEFLLIITDTASYVLYTTYFSQYTPESGLTNSEMVRYLVPLEEFVAFAKRVVDENNPQSEGFGASKESKDSIMQYILEE